VPVDPLVRELPAAVRAFKTPREDTSPLADPRSGTRADAIPGSLRGLLLDGLAGAAALPAASVFVNAVGTLAAAYLFAVGESW